MLLKISICNEKIVQKKFRKYLLIETILLIGILLTVSCKDEYLYDNSVEWLGVKIDDYLKSSDNYTYYTRLIEEVEDYKGSPGKNR